MDGKLDCFLDLFLIEIISVQKTNRLPYVNLISWNFAEFMYWFSEFSGGDVRVYYI